MAQGSFVPERGSFEELFSRSSLFCAKIAENKEKTSVFTEVSSWFRLELNQRHADFQSTALPTELQNHFGDPIIDYFFQLVKGKENITVIFLKKLLNLVLLDGKLGVP